MGRDRTARRRGHRAGRALLAALAALLGTVLGGLSPATGGPAGAETIDGQHSGGGRLPAGTTLRVPVTGRGGVPADGVDAVALNVTVTAPTQAAYLTVWPSGTARPLASNVNFAAGQTRPNMVIAKVGDDGAVAVFNPAGSLHVVVDVLGWFPAGSINSLTPARVLDTRPAGATADGQQVGIGPAAGGAVVPVSVAGRGGVPVQGVRAVALNVTAVDAATDTFVTVWPAGSPRPLASNLNVAAGATAANLVIVPLGPNGRVQLYNEAGLADLVVDVLAWFPTDGPYRGLVPARLLDTRPGAATVDGAGAGTGALGGGAVRSLPVTGRAGVPAEGVEAVAVNVTATGATAETYLAVWPSGAPRPLSSNLNVPMGTTRANMVLAKVGEDGAVSIYNEAGQVAVIVDVLGWFSTGGGYTSLNPARLADTRPPDG
ncbi:MAG: hypothetical protein R2755_31465 [Acidimicrobiales bacterium]